MNFADGVEYAGNIWVKVGNNRSMLLPPGIHDLGGFKVRIGTGVVCFEGLPDGVSIQVSVSDGVRSESTLDRNFPLRTSNPASKKFYFLVVHFQGMNHGFSNLPAGFVPPS